MVFLLALYKDYIFRFQNDILLQSAVEKIVKSKDYNKLNELICIENQTFIYVCNKENDIYKIDVTNKKEDTISSFQFQTLLKMLNNKKIIYKFSFQTISIFHHFQTPISDWILCIKYKTEKNIPYN